MRKALMCAALLLAGCGSEGDGLSKAGPDTRSQKRVLTMATRDLVFIDNAGLPAFVRAVKERSKGRLELRLVLDEGFNATSRGPIRKGAVDLAWEGEGYPGVPAWEVPYLPFLVDSHELQRELFRGDYDERLLAAARAKPWLEPLAVLPGELGRPYSLSRPLRTADDWRRRSMASRYPVDGARGRALRAIGVTRLVREPGLTPALIEDHAITVMDSLDRGLQYNSLPDYGVTGTYNAITFTRPVVIVANRRRFSRLRPEERRWLREAAADGQRAALDWVGTPDREHIGGNCRMSRVRAVLAAPSEIAELRSKVLRIYRQARDPGLRDLVESVERIRSQVAPPSFEVPPACDGPVPPAPRVVRDDGRRMLDGRYRMDITVEDFARAGLLDAAENGPDFAGVWTATLRRGKWTLTRRARESAIDDEQAVKQGTYRTSGNRVTFYEDLAPPFSFRFEKVAGGHLRWTREHPMTWLYTALFEEEWPRVQ